MKFQSTSRSQVSECQQISVYFCQWSQKLCSIRAIILTKKPCAVHTFFKTQSHTMLSCNFCIKKVHHFKPDISIHMQHAKNKYTFVYIICSTFFYWLQTFPCCFFFMSDRSTCLLLPTTKGNAFLEKSARKYNERNRIYVTVDFYV